jgi:hypothetical protein
LMGFSGAVWLYYVLKLFVARVHDVGHAAKWFMLGALMYAGLNMYRYAVYAPGTLPVWLFGIELMCVALYIAASIYYLFFPGVAQTQYPTAASWPANSDILIHKLTRGFLYGVLIWAVWLMFEDLSLGLNNRSILPLPEPLTVFSHHLVEAETALSAEDVTFDILPPELTQ